MLIFDCELSDDTVAGAIALFPTNENARCGGKRQLLHISFFDVLAVRCYTFASLNTTWICSRDGSVLRMSDMLMAVLATFVNDGSIRVDSANIIPWTIVGLALVGISHVGQLVVPRHMSRKLAATPGKNGLFCEHTIELAEEGFTETTHVNTSGPHRETS